MGWLQSNRSKFGHRILMIIMGCTALFGISYLSSNVGRQPRFPHPINCPTELRTWMKTARLPKLHVLLLSYPRSGSSFLGDLLQSYSGAFYHFEPLHYFGNVVAHNQLDSARKLMHDLFTCDYSDWGSFPEWAWFNSDYLTFRRNKRYWQMCTHKDSSRMLCYNVCYLAVACRNSPVQIIKTIRMAASEAGKLLQEYKDLNLKIVHLVRDPRGTMNSRQHKDIAAWCGKYKACASPQTFCELVNDDLKHACELQKRFPDRYTLIRYEDLALDPPQATEKLFKFLDIGPVPSEVAQFLETHTQGGPYVSTTSFLQPPYRTVRNSTQAALEWCRKMKLKDIQKVQQKCQVVLEKLAYKTVNSTLNLSVENILGNKPQFCASS
ncbi:carbohydrate sulfotransferase 1-like isoform X2 [Parasteatoda tepidariorum]|uniref:carbohydrate sulfotransferase 1-like isoform X2 n=1 Tax=Parasteatoda tepidariorum TaxID=114398 RepID=UPI00077F9EBC|nr:carbohydrate sulfotransferase 1-like isoform X2 [Parasteatoda tepidariorum]